MQSSTSLTIAPHEATLDNNDAKANVGMSTTMQDSDEKKLKNRMTTKDGDIVLTSSNMEEKEVTQKDAMLEIVPITQRVSDGVPNIAPTTTTYPTTTMTPKVEDIEQEVGWPTLVKGLIKAMIETQKAEVASATMLAIFKPIVEGWATSKIEAKRWKARAEAHMAAAHHHQAELSGHKEALETEIESLERKLEETQNLLQNKTHESKYLLESLRDKDHALETQRLSFNDARLELQSKMEELQRALDQQRALDNDLSQRNKDLAKKAHDVNLALENLRKDSEIIRTEQAHAISNLQSKVIP